jgi:hypothetical protein
MGEIPFKGESRPQSDLERKANSPLGHEEEDWDPPALNALAEQASMRPAPIRQLSGELMQSTSMCEAFDASNPPTLRPPAPAPPRDDKNDEVKAWSSSTRERPSPRRRKARSRWPIIAVAYVLGVGTAWLGAELVAAPDEMSQRTDSLSDASHGTPAVQPAPVSAADVSKLFYTEEEFAAAAGERTKTVAEPALDEPSIAEPTMAAPETVSQTEPSSPVAVQPQTKAIAADEPTTEESEEPVVTPPLDRGALSAAVGAAAANATACGGDGSKGSAVIAITFAPSGRATVALVVGGSLLGTPAASCVARTMRTARIPAFTGEAVTARRTIRLR